MVGANPPQQSPLLIAEDSRGWRLKPRRYDSIAASATMRCGRGPVTAPALGISAYSLMEGGLPAGGLWGRLVLRLGYTDLALVDRGLHGFPLDAGGR